MIPLLYMALASSLCPIRQFKKPVSMRLLYCVPSFICSRVRFPQRFSALASCISCASPFSLSTRKYDVSRDSEERQQLERGSNITSGPSLKTFPSHLLALLREAGRDGGGREGVGGVSQHQSTAARTDLLNSLEATQSQLLSPEVNDKIN